MKNIIDLRNNLEVFRKSGAINSASYTSLATSLKEVETELESVEKEVSVNKELSGRLLGEKLVLEREKLALSSQVEKLSREKAVLESQISVLQRTRPALSPANLVSTFRASLEEMDKGLKTAPSGTKYQVSSMNVSLKTNLALDGEELRFQMPKADDIILPENLSTIEFSLKAVPQKPDLTSYGEVPDLIGLSKETAEGKLLEAGFKAGEILKKESSAPQGTVIAQLPSEGSLAEPGAVVDLVISGASPVEVPNLLGLELESAKQVIEKSLLQLGGVREQPSEGKPGMVLAQSLRAGSKVDAGSSLVLVVSTDVLSVPNLLGLELESAKQVIEKSLLQLGGVREQPSEGKAGVVLAQSLKPGAEARVNSKILLTVSVEIKKEPPEIIVPERPKRTFPETIVKAPAGTVVKPSSEAPAKSPVEAPAKPSTEAPSRVSAESEVKVPVEAPAKVSAETPVKVSADALPKRVVPEPSKPEVRAIPNIVSMPLEKAVSALEGVGLKVGKVSEILTRSPAGTVISQSPRAGSIANPLIPVDLVVSKGMPAINLDRSSISSISSISSLRR